MLTYATYANKPRAVDYLASLAIRVFTIFAIVVVYSSLPVFMAWDKLKRIGVI